VNSIQAHFEQGGVIIDYHVVLFGFIYLCFVCFGWFSRSFNLFEQVCWGFEND